VDFTFELAGYALYFTEARVQYNPRQNPPYQLILIGKPPSELENGMQLYRLLFSSVTRPDGKSVLFDPAQQAGDMVIVPNGMVYQTEQWWTGKLQVEITLDVTAENETDLLPGSYQVELNGATVRVEGPWTVDFSISP
jgi:hypothetical protein